MTTDYRYEIYNAEKYLIGDCFVALDSAIEFALENDGAYIERVYYPMDEHGFLDYDEPMNKHVIWRVGTAECATCRECGYSYTLEQLSCGICGECLCSKHTDNCNGNCAECEE